MKKREFTYRKMIIHCINCKTSTTRDSSFKYQYKQTCDKKNVKLNPKTPPTSVFDKNVPTLLLTPKLNMLQSILNKSNSSTPKTSPLTLTPGSNGSSSKSNRKRNRGKSFSPLMSLEQKQVKKTPDKPSLLSFLTSL